MLSLPHPGSPTGAAAGSAARSAAESPGAPDGLPVPRRFAHLAPGDGACLMETASVLAGEPFTDGPRGTHPALAALARVVNDSVGDRARSGLWPLAARLAHARPDARAFAPLLVADVLREAERVRPRSPVLALRRAACERRALRVGTAGAGTRRHAFHDVLWWRGPGRHHLEHALRVLRRDPRAEERLTRLLHHAVTTATPPPAPAAPMPARPDGPELLGVAKPHS